MQEVVQLTPNKWITEDKLVAVTGLRPGTIAKARKTSWMQAGNTFISLQMVNRSQTANAFITAKR